jgi:glutathione S-transferase
MKKLELFYSPTACSLVSYIALKEAGAPFEVHPINLGKKEHMSEKYLEINPKHRVPVLVIDGEPLTENIAIILWIDQNFPNANLLPKDSMQRAQAISILAWCASGIHPALTPNALPQRYCDLPNTAENVKQCAQKLLTEYFSIAENMLRKKTWFFDSFSFADIYFFWCFRRAKQFDIDLNNFINFQSHFENMLTREYTQELIRFEQDILEKFNA